MRPKPAKKTDTRQRRVLIGLALAAALAAVGASVLFGGNRAAPGDVFFYDLSEKRLYRASRDAFAPEPGDGGEAGDGVEAVVVRCDRCPSETLRIAYLRTHTPEYKAKREESRRTGAGIEGLTREWILEHTLVRLVDQDAWHKTSSPQGVKIVSGWKRRCSEHGEYEKPCKP